jgi:UDP-N-acetylmuramoylalanine--D-glutamate ligase
LGAKRFLIVGAGIAAAACAEALLDDGCEVTVVDRVPSARLDELHAEGASVVVADPAPLTLLNQVDDVIVSPGVPPHDPLASAAVDLDHDVYSEPELAWRRRGEGAPPWLAITGTNGKTTTTTMVASILRAAGLRTEALGNIGVPLVFAATGTPVPGALRAFGALGSSGAPGGGYDVLAVELSSFQLYWSSSLAPEFGVLLNLADDHLEWHGTFDEYAAAKLDVWRAATPQRGGIAIGNLDDPRVAAALREVTGTTVGFTLGEPAPGQLGVVDGVLVDLVDWHRDDFAFGTPPVALIEAAAIRPSGAHNVSNALAAAAITRAYGVSADAVRAGLTDYVPEPHRNAPVATIGGVRYVDDSKATNPHAAAASLGAYPSIVWVAGGQLKGVDIDELVGSIVGRLRGAVLLGVDRADIGDALARHAPTVPVVDVASTDDGAMVEVVRAAAALAHPGDTVLLAPAAASKDMFASYAARGDAFARAVRDLGPVDG